MTPCPACGLAHPGPAAPWFCWLAAFDRRYQAAWGLAVTAPVERPPVPDWVRQGGRGDVTPVTPPAAPPTADEAEKVRGLGDDVESIARVLGLDRLAKLVEGVTGRPCGCQERQDLLNNLPSVRDAIRRLFG